MVKVLRQIFSTFEVITLNYKRFRMHSALFDIVPLRGLSLLVQSIGFPLLAPTTQNDQTHSNNSLAVAEELFKCLTILWGWRIKD